MLNCALEPERPLPRRTPTSFTAGSASSMSVMRRWRCAMSANDTVALELARPQIRPVSCGGNEPFSTAPTRNTVATISSSGVIASSSAWRSEKSSART
jgi:hypothetical protein